MTQGRDELLAALRPERLAADLEAFRVHGAIEGGGVDRPALSDADMAARRALERGMRDAGLRVETDAVGNTWGRLGPGDGPAVVAGSHLDSVPRGGAFDGPLGVLAPLEVARAMKDAGLRPPMPFEVVSFTGEEGSRFVRGTLGSWAASMVVPLEEALATPDLAGTTLAEAMRKAGYPSDLPGPRRPEDRFRAFVELHIEQGGILESKGIGLGVVRAIAGLVHLEVEVHGTANHAGTTPMSARADALAAASEMVIRIEERARLARGAAVATVGRLEVSPGAWNIIPGSVRFGIDLRSAEPAMLETMERDIRRAIAFVASVRGVSTKISLRQRIAPGPLDSSLVERAAAACEAIGEAHLVMTSGAIHDALEISRVAPAVMLFVPSIGGKSHTPEEATSEPDVARGLRALAAVVWDLLSPAETVDESLPTAFP